MSHSVERSDAVIEYVTDGRGTAKVIGVQTFDAEEHPALKKAGYAGKTTMYMIIGKHDSIMDYDRYRLIQRFGGTGDWEWLHDEFQKLEARLA